MSKEAIKLRTAAEKVVELCSERPLSLGKWFIDMSEACESLREALAEQPAQQEPKYAWPTVADYERDVGFETNQAFRMAWNMARTTNKMLGHTSPPAQQEPVPSIIQMLGHCPECGAKAHHFTKGNT